MYILLKLTAITIAVFTIVRTKVEIKGRTELANVSVENTLNAGNISVDLPANEWSSYSICRR